jgi:hypothetical protein
LISSVAFSPESRVAVIARLRQDLELTRIEWHRAVNRWKELSFSESPESPCHDSNAVEDARVRMIAARQRFEAALRKFEAVVLHGRTVENLID